ncbi:MAG: type II secretion system F family protein [Blautia sp.]
MLLAFTFFQRIWGLFLTFPVMLLYVKYAEGKLMRKKKHQLEVQFKDAILAVASSLQAGYSLAHAFEDALEISREVYGKRSMIVLLFEKLVWGQKLNVPMDQLLEELAERSQLEVVRNFTEVVKVTRRYGGNLPDMIQKLAGVIEDRLTVKAEIMSVTTSVRYEAYIMDVIPVAIIWYMNVTGPSFLEALYSAFAGRLFMTVCMLIYMGTVVWQFHMMENMID